MEDSIPVLLIHSGVDIEATVSELGNFLSKKLDSLGSVAEDDGLRYVQLGEQCVEAMELLPLFQVGVVLGQTLESELIGQSDKVWMWYVPLLELLDLLGVGGGVQEDLLLLRHDVDNLLDDYLEVL